MYILFFWTFFHMRFRKKNFFIAFWWLNWVSITSIWHQISIYPHPPDFGKVDWRGLRPNYPKNDQKCEILEIVEIFKKKSCCGIFWSSLTQENMLFHFRFRSIPIRQISGENCRDLISYPNLTKFRVQRATNTFLFTG